MKAIVYEKYGTPEVLALKEVDTPVPSDDEVLVKVYAVSVNDWDWGLLKGKPFVTRLSGLMKPSKKILGSDIAGRVEKTGKNINKFKSGDEVYGDLSGAWGGFAEYACAGENSLELKPPSMTFEEAAAIPQAAMLAVQGLIDKGNIQPGQKLLINGAGGGVGTLGIQIARQYGIEATGVDSKEKHEMLRSIGFDHVIDYKKEDFTRNGKKYDLILDVKTNRPVFNYLRALNRGGTYVTVGGKMGKLLEALLLGPLVSLLTGKHVRIVALKPNKDLRYINELYVAGKLKPVIDGQYSLSDVPKAMQYFGEAKHIGKVVITVQNSRG